LRDRPRRYLLVSVGTIFRTDSKNYQMWSKQMGAFLRGKGQIFWDVTVDTGYVQPMDFLAPGSRDRFDANNKVVDYLFHALCQPEFDRVHTSTWLVEFGRC
jgi:hypothetical protein